MAADSLDISTVVFEIELCVENDLQDIVWFQENPFRLVGECPQAAR